VFANANTVHFLLQVLPGVLLIGDISINGDESEEQLLGGDTDSFIMQHRPPSLGFTDLSQFTSASARLNKRQIK
jgi:hypothetical protein